MSNGLKNIKVIFLATDHFEQVELTTPWQALKAAGALPELVSTKQGTIQGNHHAQPGDSFKVDKTIDQCAVTDYAGLVLPGGVFNPDTLRLNPEAIRLIQEFVYAKKPVAAICHAPWLLVEADVVRGRKLTSWPSLETDIKNAGGTWVNEQVVEDDGIITSRKPDDLEAFSMKMIAVLSSKQSAEKRKPSNKVATELN